MEAPAASRARSSTMTPGRRSVARVRRGRAADGAAPVGPTAGARLDAHIERRRQAFERRFARLLPAATAPPASLHGAMRYSALSPGKRTRPLLALLACEAMGGRWTAALPAAAAVECVHAFSLVHDDLPALDDDDFRRGRPTTHKRYGEAVALLAGDALLALAFERLDDLERTAGPRAAAAALRLLGRASGSHDLVGGQVLDLEAEGRRVTARGVRDIHARKTAALIAASLVLGGIAARAPVRRLRALAALGRDLGLAFQIQDDLLNRRSTLGRLGKRAGTDDARGKATFPRAVGEARAEAEYRRLLTRARRRAAGLGARAAPLGRLIEQLADRSR